MMLVFLLIHFILLVAAIAAAVFGLWSIVAVDVLAWLCVALGLRACAAEKSATLTYEEITSRKIELPPVRVEVPEVPEETGVPEALPLQDAA